MPSVLIIGAGPAGSLAGLLLARAAFVVDLLEQHSFPRDKVCGECLSALGIDVLERAGLNGLLLQLHPVKLGRTLLHPLSGPAIELALPRTMWGLTRRAMDHALLNAAVAAGVRLHVPARCEQITPASNDGSKGLASVVWRDLSTNATIESFADWILVADGKGSLLGRSPAATGDLGIKTHFANVNGPRDAIELFAGHGHYGGLAAVEDDHWCAAFNVPAARVRSHGGNLQGLFGEIVGEIPVLAESMAGALRVSPWLASPLPRFAVAQSWPQRVIPLGNAAAALEPVGGEGMGLALRSAELAVEAIVAAEYRGSPAELGCLRSRFRELWRIRQVVCRGIGRVFSNPLLAEAVAPLMSANPRIPVTFMRWAGKTKAEAPDVHPGLRQG